MHEALIVVGADGSAGSRRALEWALQEAEFRHCGVEVVAAYLPGAGETSQGARERSVKLVHRTLDDIVAGRVDIPTVDWKVVEGAAADVLTLESQRAQLLVMGSHGVGGMRRSALGSAADVCARLAECPVVVIPSGITLDIGAEA